MGVFITRIPLYPPFPKWELRHGSVKLLLPFVKWELRHTFVKLLLPFEKGGWEGFQ
jgi:hypothetical protein